MAGLVIFGDAQTIEAKAVLIHETFLSKRDTREDSPIKQYYNVFGKRHDHAAFKFIPCANNSFQVVADEKGVFRSISRKTAKNNSAQVGQNFQNQLPDNLSGI